MSLNRSPRDCQHRLRRRIAGWLTLIAVCASPIAARAQEDPAPMPTPRGDPANARLYFNAGARAYAAGKYGPAIRAFEEAYRIDPRPGLVFSIAQAYRRQYFIDKAKENLSQAIHYYRQYLELDPDGARRGDTAEALSELEPLASKLTPSEAAAPPPQSIKAATQLMISSPIDDVAISLDGSPAGSLPYIAAVNPGVHRVRLTADGYFAYEREVRVLDGSVVPLDVALQERPALLTVTAPEGARISVDGRLRGVLASPPIVLTPGRHFVTITLNGHDPFSREIVVTRDEKRSLQAVLPATGQRTVAWVLIGTGTMGLLAGGGLMVGAAVREQNAKGITIRTSDDIRAYNDAVDSRNQLRTAGIATAGAGLVVGAIGVFLYAFDEPRVGIASTEEPVPEQPAPRREHPALDVSATPWFSPGAAGASLRGVF
jgi:tetratricopeptide (TPR) repeat protein